MIRFLGGLALGLALGTAIITSRAQSEVPDDVLAAADEAHVKVPDLLGAMTTTGLDARTYLCRVGELPCPLPPSPRGYAYQAYPDLAWCIDRIVDVEAPGWATAAWNRTPWGRLHEHASGLGGFLPSTWATTPQGKAGRSIWDGQAQVDGMAWMLRQKRGREFAAVSWGRCHGLLGLY